MLQWLMKLLGKKPAPSHSRQGMGMPQAAPEIATQSIAEAATASTTATNFLGRSAILNRQLAVVGYEFQIKQSPGSSPLVCDALLLDKLVQGRATMFIHRRLTFIPLHPLSLNHPQIEQLPADNLVLLVTLPTEPLAGEQIQALRERVAELQGKGYALAFDQALEQGPLAPLLAFANYLHLDAKGGDPIWLLERQKHCHAAFPNVPMIVRNIDSLELLDACRKLAFQFFQGNYLTSTREWGQPRIDTSRAVILELIGHIAEEDIDFKQMARIAGQDLSLYYRLLRYVNSAAFGLNKKFDSLEHAMVLLGREGLRQWLTLMLLSSSKADDLDVALRETAFVRARLVELLAQEHCTRAECEQAFLVGLLSLIDALFHMPLADALQKLALPDPVVDALLNRGGKLGNYLSLAIACEKGYEGAIEELAKTCGLDSQQINAKQVAALNWASEFNDQLAAMDQAEPTNTPPAAA